MNSGKAVVIDTNILFSCLLKTSSPFSHLILGNSHSFYICESVIVELFRHKERIKNLSRLEETDIIRLYYTLLRSLNRQFLNMIIHDYPGRAGFFNHVNHE